eukprot:12425268-Karenia_brevis.AAC.1
MGPKPPEVINSIQPGPEAQPSKKVAFTTGGKFMAISDEHFRSNVDRVPDTFELSDLFKYGEKQIS